MEDGSMPTTFRQLSQLGNTHFKHLFMAPQEATIAEIVKIAGHFPRFVDLDSTKDLISSVTQAELEGTLKWFKKDKSLGPTGWTIKFFLAFYELIGLDLLKVVEECRSSRHMYEAINSTFIALFPKSDSPASFNDFRPISLCNCLYKIVAKIIANRL